MQTLPIHAVLPEVRQVLRNHTRLILQAPPGAGKTTALPLALLEEPWLAGRKILMLEPRRLAVRASAARMAEMLGEKVGERIGYQIRMESRQSAKTRIVIVTEGILTRMLQQDPALEDVALVIFDEFHERSLHADLALALALESQTLLREDLKLLVMSATLGADALSRLLDDAPVIRSEGRSFPVERHYLEASAALPKAGELAAVVMRQIEHSLAEEEGNILVFLPGVRQIRAVEKRLRAGGFDDLIIAPLYGDLGKEAQERAIAAPPARKRKVVLATTIAQTSLTIEGITVVIDSGLHNVLVFDPSSGMDRLETQVISKATAAQRAGRAGRLLAGRAYHLWPVSRILPDHDRPEILSADLSQMLLALAQWGTSDPETLCWLDRPPAASVKYAKELLQRLGALDDKGRITRHGEMISRYGLHPRVAHMMQKAKTEGLVYEASLLAVLLTEKDIFRSGYHGTDLKERVEILHDMVQRESVRASWVDLAQCRYLLKLAKRIRVSIGEAAAEPATLRSEALGILLAYAYPDRIAQLRHSKDDIYLLSNGKGAHLHPEDSLRGSRYLVISDLDAGSSNATIYKALRLTLAQIETHLETTTAERVSWNEAQARVEVRRAVTLGALTLKEAQLSSVDSPEVIQVLLERIRRMGLEMLGWSKEANRLRERVNFLHLHESSFPDFSDRRLLDTLEAWLAPHLEGISTRKALEALDLYPILRGMLTYSQIQMLERLAPEKIRVASGSRISIDYSDATQPLLAVRLQEMFGSIETPTVMGGRVTLMLHLLSPAFRPVQVTKDLANFWKSTYAEVKKELRGRYKKHYWPDDPLQAEATGRAKPRR